MKRSDKVQRRIEGGGELDDTKETGRLEAFSDGVFAVAITLLVLDVDSKVSGEVHGESLLAHLWQQWPSLLAFVISFLTVGIMWINHHRLFTHIRRIDTGLLILNLVLLMIIVFVPVPTGLLAEYSAHGENYSNYLTAAVIYSATFLLIAVCFNLLWRYASYQNRLLGNTINHRAVQAISRQYLFGPVLYAITLILAFIYVPASVAANFVLALFFALPGRSAKAEIVDAGQTEKISERV